MNYFERESSYVESSIQYNTYLTLRFILFEYNIPDLP